MGSCMDNGINGFLGTLTIKDSKLLGQVECMGKGFGVEQSQGF